MRKLACLLICALLLAGIAIPVAAGSGMQVIFTADSKFEAGGTVTVDEMATMMSVMDDPNVTADYYNAALEHNVQYYWFRNDSWYGEGKSIKLTDADKGCEFFVRIAFYSDADRVQQFGALDSATFTVPNSGNPAMIPTITTTSLPNGKVGETYYQKLECSDPDVRFELFRSSLPDGLTLTQHGEIEGTPTKAGFWYVVVMATPEAGEEYAATKEYEFTIEEEGPQYTIEIQQLPNKITYTAGEKLDMTGLRVRIWTPDGYIDSKDGERLTYSRNALVTLGEQKIKLAYEDAFEIFIVTVVAAPTEPATEPTTAPTEESKATEPSKETETTAAPTEGTEEATQSTAETFDPTAAIPDRKDDGKTDGVSGTAVFLIVIIALVVVLVAAIVVMIILIVTLKKKR